MIIPTTPEEFINLLKKHFHFCGLDDQNTPFISDINAFGLRSKVAITDKQGAYTIHAIHSPYSFYLIDYRGGFSTQVSIDPEQEYLACIPSTNIPVSPLHRHTHLELVCILDGSLDFLIEGIHKRYHHGEFCLLNTNVRHVEENRSDYTAFYLNIDNTYLHKLLSDKPLFRKTESGKMSKLQKDDSSQICLDFSPLTNSDSLVGTTRNIEQIFYQIALELLHKEPEYKNIIDNLIRRIFTYLQSPRLYRCSQFTFQGMAPQTTVEQILLYLQSHPYKLKLKELSEFTGYNASYLNRVFFKHMGQTIADYNRQIYLKEAENLLLNTDLSVSEIAVKLHFESRTAFYEQFHKKYGVTPREYRTTS